MSLTELNVPILSVVSNAHTYMLFYNYGGKDIHLMCFFNKGNNFLKCDPSGLFPVTVSGNCSNGLCVDFNGTSVGDIATYFTTPDYCINSTSGLNFTRECLDTGLWSGNAPIKLIGKPFLHQLKFVRFMYKMLS